MNIFRHYTRRCFVVPVLIALIIFSCTDDTTFSSSSTTPTVESTFPGAVVLVGMGTDYRYRAEIPREKVAQAVADMVMSIDYSNFKNSVEDHRLHAAYSRVWSVMYRLQVEQR